MNRTFYLHSGAYNIKISYHTPDLTELSDDADNLGKVSFLTENPIVLKSNEIKLSRFNRDVTSRFWIRPGTKTIPVNIIVSENETGKLQIDKIELTEKRVYKIAVCFLVVLLFLLLDGGYIFLSMAEDLDIKEKRRFVMLSIFIITFFSSMTFFAGSLLVGHDLEFHLSRIICLADALREHQIPNRIEFGMLNGGGYANPLYYGELFLTIPACLYNCYIPLQVCYQIYVVLVNLATAYISYWCFEKMAQNWKNALLGAAVYTLSSYRILGLLLRSSVGEYTAMTFFPLLAYGFWKLYQNRDSEKLSLPYILPFVIAGTGIINSHTLSCEILLIFIIPFVLFNKKTYRKNILACLIKSASLTVLLNIWFIVPFLQSMQMRVNVTADSQIGKIENTGNYLPQLFAVFHIGTWHAQSAIDGNGGMTISLGSALVIGILLFFGVLVKKESWQLQREKELYIAKIAFAIGCIALLFSSRLCWWDNLEYISTRLARFLGKIQFSWRYLSIATIAFSIMLLFVMQIIQKHTSAPNYNALLLTLLTVLILTEGYFFVDSSAVWEDGESYYSSADLGTFKIGNGEYLLADTDWTFFSNCKCICGDGVAESGYHYETNGNYDLSCTNSHDTVSYVDVPVQMYEHYHAYAADGKELPLSVGQNNCIRIHLPAYFEGTIRLSYQPPVLWKLCECISLFTFIGLTAVTAREKQR